MIGLVSNPAVLHPMLNPIEEKYTPLQTPYHRDLETGIQSDARPQQGPQRF